MRTIGRAAALVVIGAASTALGIGTADGIPKPPSEDWRMAVFVMALVVVLGSTVGLATWFVHAFTRELATGSAAATERELKPMVRFCYVFTLYCLGVAVLPAALMAMAPQSVYYKMLRGPIALVKGCVHVGDEHKEERSWALACDQKDPYKLEWFLNIGGSARLRREGAGILYPDGRPPTEAGAAGAAALRAGDAPPVKDEDGSMHAIDKWIDATRFAPATVHGGLVVPWYVISLALMGATVSLARKVPEYQRRAIDVADDTMNGPRMREALEFEVLQVLSAPFIAITAFNLITPASMGSSAAIGFASGFSSEPLLMAIRSLVDRIVGRPAPSSTSAKTLPEPPPPGDDSIPPGGPAEDSGSVTIAQPDSAAQAAPTAA